MKNYDFLIKVKIYYFYDFKFLIVRIFSFSSKRIEEYKQIFFF